MVVRLAIALYDRICTSSSKEHPPPCLGTKVTTTSTTTTYSVLHSPCGQSCLVHAPRTDRVPAHLSLPPDLIFPTKTPHYPPEPRLNPSHPNFASLVRSYPWALEGDAIATTLSCPLFISHASLCHTIADSATHFWSILEIVPFQTRFPPHCGFPCGVIFSPSPIDSRSNKISLLRKFPSCCASYQHR